MSGGYVAVHWNRRKQLYDLALWLGVFVYLAAFFAVGLARYGDGISPIILMMRALSSCAFLMLSLVLCIGPLARLNPRLLPLLYNRRHFGVSTFIVALAHAGLAVYWYHSFGVVNPLVSIFTSGGVNPIDGQPVGGALFGWSFQAFGALALMLLFLLAATSHDYWNATLTARGWKALHMAIYAVYTLVIVHVAFGAMRQEGAGWLPWMVFIIAATVGGLHIVAAHRTSKATRAIGGARDDDEWIAVSDWRDIPNNRAITIDIGAHERIAVFRYDDRKLAAVSNVCQHQSGPLGEGCVVDGLITCPWHGYQYRPEDGRSPPPFTEKIRTYRLKLDGHQVLVNAEPLPPGTPRAVLLIEIE